MAQQTRTQPVVKDRERGGSSPRKLWFRIADYALMIFLAGFFLFPTLFMFVSSFKEERQIFADLQTVVFAFIPRGASLDNFRFVFNRVPFLRYLLNSLFITVVTVGLGLFFNSMIAYALARLRWRGKGLVLAVVIALIIVPLEAISIPMLVLVNALPWFNVAWDGPAFLGVTLPTVQFVTSWLDSYQVQMIPFIAYPLGIFLFYQFFLDIPKEFDEAAIVDGAGPFEIYWRVIAPLARPAFATVAILHSLVMWSAYLWPLMVTRGEAVRPLTIGITQMYLVDLEWGALMAYASMATLPILAIFLLFQRWFVQSVASSGVKG